MIRRHATTFGFALAAALLTAATASATDEQMIKYFRKKSNIPPAVKVAVTGTKDSTAIKGTKEG